MLCQGVFRGLIINLNRLPAGFQKKQEYDVGPGPLGN